MRFVLSGLFIAVVLSAVGCDSRGGLAEADYERAKSALESALTAWQNGESAQKWAAKSAKVRFYDEVWGVQKQTLLEFEILELRAKIDKAPEALVRLKTRSPKGVESEQEALYGIDLRSGDQVSIGRDPMH